MKVGYARVSTVEQNEERQLVTLTNLGAEKIFQDKLSGKNTNRPGLKEMLEFVREGDTVIVSEYSRLARSTDDLLNIFKKLQKKGVNIISDHEKFDASTPQGKLMLTFFAGISEFERTLMLQRQAEGIAVAKKKGKYKGRAKAQKPADWAELYHLYAVREISGTELIKRCGASRGTVYSWIREEKA